MRPHISDVQLRRYIAASERLSVQEKGEIDVHLSSCALCADYVKKLRLYYDEISQETDSPPTAQDQSFAENILFHRSVIPPARRLEKKKDAVEVFEPFEQVITTYQKPAIQRFIEFMYVHPIRAAGAFTFAAAIVGGLVFGINRFQSDTNPSMVKIDNAQLSAYNTSGNVLWTKNARGFSTVSNIDLNTLPSKVLEVDDIDADGTNEVLVTGSIFDSPDFARDTLYCFNPDGSLRWAINGGVSVAFGTQFYLSEHTQWVFIDFFVYKNQRVRKTQLFAIAMLKPNWPSKLLELDPRTGNILQYYLHTGKLGRHLILDIDSDGKGEIILEAINNAFRMAAIVALDPENIKGCGPTLPEFFPASELPGTECYYVLLPKSDLFEAKSSFPYNSFEFIYPLAENSFVAYTNESSDKDYPGGVLYTFSDSMKITSVVGGDSFIQSHERLQKEGVFSKKLDEHYYNDLKNGIRYWNGKQFVKEVTVNSHSLISKKLP
jgi:hypothetical protein